MEQMKTLMQKSNISRLIFKMLFLSNLIFSISAVGSTPTDPDEKEQITGILTQYAKDYEQDVTLKKDVTFAVKVGDDFWHVVAKAGTKEDKASVTLAFGKPAVPTFYFFTDLKTLKMIEQGKMNALTASAKAFETDFAPFDVDVMEGYQPAADFFPTLMSVYFHFWTKGSPEIIPFNTNLTRTTHGAQASIFFYQPGFRSGYVAVKKGQHANQEEASKTNPFPTLLIIIKGEGQAIINGKKLTLKEGQAVLIPTGVQHEFLNPDHEEPMEAIILMFGEGA